MGEKMIEREIDSVILELGLGKSLRKMDRQESGSLIDLVRSDFVLGNPRFWWTALKGELVRREAGRASYRDIPSIIDSVIEDCYFIPDPGESKSLVYFGPFCNFCEVIENCFYFEFYFLSEAKDWLACENHHDQIIVSDLRFLGSE